MLSPASCLELRAVGGDASRVHVKAPNEAGGPRSTCMCKTTLRPRDKRLSTVLYNTMNSLVAYESSDDEDNIQPEKPAEVGDCYSSAWKSTDAY